jgi:hypothetical protein
MSTQALLLTLLAGSTALVPGTLRGSATPVTLPEGAVPVLAGNTVPGLPPVCGNLRVDQFGYLPDAAKVAVLANPVIGYNRGFPYSPGDRLELRRADDGSVVLHGPALPVNEGAVDPVSGDSCWWFDFSAVRKPGRYYVFDPRADVRSPVFRIAEDVYAPVLRAATRMYFYQREAFAKKTPYAEAPWTDEAAFTQDRHARAVWARDDASTERELSGGWADAGDTNKYPTFLPDVIHPLLYAWMENPEAFTDDTGIPESGNGLPDLLDEVKWELDWLAKMQDTDGGVFLKLGAVDYHTPSPLSLNDHPRYYAPKASSSTIAAAAVFAHAARVYARFPQCQTYAGELRTRSLRAWNWYKSHPRDYDLDRGVIKSGDADMSPELQDRTEAMAALQLWEIDGDPRFHEAFAAKISAFRQMAYANEWPAYETSHGEALLDYARRPDAEPALRERILRHFRQVCDQPPILPPAPGSDPYRAWMPLPAYHWGSVLPRAGLGNVALSAISHGLAGGQARLYRERAEGLLHSFHGVNPLGMVYLSNMKACGAELSAMHIWHDWFKHDSQFGANPAPGYVVGGPNSTYKGSFKWITEQPPGKTYADFNDPWPSEAWAITEPGIYYQANYIRLLASFTKPAQSGGKR